MEPSSDVVTETDDVAVTSEETNQNRFQEIILEDGTRAVISADLWDNFLQNVESEDGTGNRADRRFPCLFDGCDKVYTTSHHLTVSQHLVVHLKLKKYCLTKNSWIHVSVFI